MVFSWSDVLLIILPLSYFLYRKYLGLHKCRSRVQLRGKTVVITGGNKGIGKETARDLAKRGARVILACRDTDAGQRTAEEIQVETGAMDNVRVLHLDLSSLKSVRSFSDEFLRTEEKLHILINNAGVGWIPRRLSKDGYEMMFAVNHLGHFLLTKLLLDRLKSCAPSRVVTVSSAAIFFKSTINWDDVMYEKGFSQWAAYCQSKVANVLFTRHLARLLEGTRVASYTLHPGSIDSGFADNLLPFRLPVIRYVIRAVTWLFMKTPTEGAQTTIHCAVAEELADQSGKYYDNCKEAKPPKECLDETAAVRLWELSEKLVAQAAGQ